MKNLLLATLLTVFAFISCTRTPVNRYDVAGKQAKLPQEEAPHERNSLEWWYLTGNLKDTKTGQLYGVEYVFFHFSPNGKKDYQMVNFAVSDPQTQQFRYDYDYEKLPRPLLGKLPLRLSMTKKKQEWTLSGQEGSYHLQARMADHLGTAINLTTTPAKPILLHNGTGYDRNVAMTQVGYYTYPRLTTTGTIEVGGEQHEVTGELWYDRQWNCNMRGMKNIAWDWFSIQLDDPRDDLMLYNLTHSPSNTQLGGGSLFTADATNTHLDKEDFQVENLAYWTSPTSGQRYPAKWRVRVPSKGYDLLIEPLIPDQELRIHFYAIFNLYYWEGMCRVTGTHNGQPVHGTSYVEITNRKGKSEALKGEMVKAE